jgi:hypothetical protein
MRSGGSSTARLLRQWLSTCCMFRREWALLHGKHTRVVEDKRSLESQGIAKSDMIWTTYLPSRGKHQYWEIAANQRTLRLGEYVYQYPNPQKRKEPPKIYRMCIGTRSLTHSTQMHRSIVLLDCSNSYSLFIICFQLTHQRNEMSRSMAAITCGSLNPGYSARTRVGDIRLPRSPGPNSPERNAERLLGAPKTKIEPSSSVLPRRMGTWAISPRRMRCSESSKTVTLTMT